MAVRNFWVEAEIDGRETNAKGDPVRKDGGMEVTIYQRDDGTIKEALRIVCRAYGESLVTKVDCDGERVCEFVTTR